MRQGTDEFSDDELRTKLMDAYQLIEDILNGVAPDIIGAFIISKFQRSILATG